MQQRRSFSRILLSVSAGIVLVCFMVTATAQESPQPSARFNSDIDTPHTAAATVEQSPHLAVDKVRVIVYRYKQYAGSAIRPSIYCDEKDTSRVQNGRYVALSLAPGKHTFRSTDAQSQIELDLKPGQEYYIRIDIAAGMWKGHGRLTLVQPEQGAAELKQMKPVDSGMIKDKEFVAADFEPAK